MDEVPVEAIVQQFAWLLLGAALVGMVAWRVRIPYAVALVLGGLLVAESGLITVPQLEPRLLLFVFLPPLLFDAAFRLDDRELRTTYRSILLLALPGVLITVLAAGSLLALAVRLPLSAGVLFGSIVAATDPIAVTAVFKQLHVSARLSTIAEGESLINDGIALTLFTALTGLAVTGSIDPLKMMTFFGKEVLGGVVIGAGAGVAFSHLTGTIDNHLIEMMLSTALAYGSYLIAQSAGASGPLACVAAGLIHGSYGRRIGMSENTRQLLDDLWEYLGFLANGLLFLLVGFSANVTLLLAEAWPVTVAVVSLLATRVVVIELATLIIPRERVMTSPAGRIVLAWGGLRGALTIALALALPPDLPSRALLTRVAFGVVLFTLLVQGLTLPLLVRRVGLAHDREVSGS